MYFNICTYTNIRTAARTTYVGFRIKFSKMLTLKRLFQIISIIYGHYRFHVTPKRSLLDWGAVLDPRFRPNEKGSIFVSVKSTSTLLYKNFRFSLIFFCIYYFPIILKNNGLILTEV